MEAGSEGRGMRVGSVSAARARDRAPPSLTEHNLVPGFPPAARRLLWALTTGWVLFLLYVLASGLMLGTLVFAPFALQVLRLAVFALDGGITLEPYTPMVTLSMRVRLFHSLQKGGGVRAVKTLSSLTLASAGGAQQHPQRRSVAKDRQEGLFSGTAEQLLAQPGAPLHHRRQRVLGGADRLGLCAAAPRLRAGARADNCWHPHRVDQH